MTASRSTFDHYHTGCRDHDAAAAATEMPNGDVNSVDKNGQTALIRAVRGRELKCAEVLLLTKGADATIHDDKGMTAMHYVGHGRGSDQDKLALADLLLEKGANPDARDFAGKTPLMLLSDWCRPNTMRRQLKAAADPNIADQKGCTALHHLGLGRSSQEQRLEIAEILLAFGADPTVLDSKKRSPAETAAGKGERALADRLECAAREKGGGGRAAAGEDVAALEGKLAEMKLHLEVAEQRAAEAEARAAAAERRGGGRGAGR